MSKQNNWNEKVFFVHIIQATIAHALEKTKYEDSDNKWKEFDPKYHFSSQFTADLISMNSADFIIASTYQEIAGRWFNLFHEDNALFSSRKLDHGYNIILFGLILTAKKERDNTRATWASHSRDYTELSPASMSLIRGSTLQLLARMTLYTSLLPHKTEDSPSFILPLKNYCIAKMRMMNTCMSLFPVYLFYSFTFNCLNKISITLSEIINYIRCLFKNSKLIYFLSVVKFNGYFSFWIKVATWWTRRNRSSSQWQG